MPPSLPTALRLTAFYNSFGGFIDAVQPNLSVNEDVNSGDRTGARLALRMQPSDRLSITPRVFYQKVEMDGWNREDAFNILANPYTTTRPAVDMGDPHPGGDSARGATFSIFQT